MQRCQSDQTGTKLELDEHTVQSSCGGYTRKVWLIKGPQEEEHPLCVFLDGEFYIERVGALPILERLQQSPKLPSMSYLFVSYEDAAARQKDLICNPQYSKFIAEDLVHWAKQQIPTLRDRKHVLCGVSLSGLMSGYTTIHYPEVFSFSLCQSGSFWWKHEWFAEQVRSVSPIRGRFWFGVGDKETEEQVSHPPTLYQEISQISGVQKAAQLFSKLGAEVHYHLYSGGHEAEPWREELAEAVEWLLS